ncbi:hypothetical protein BGX28_008189, partial [Mortierella sp. GBA30]
AQLKCQLKVPLGIRLKVPLGVPLEYWFCSWNQRCCRRHFPLAIPYRYCSGIKLPWQIPSWLCFKYARPCTWSGNDGNDGNDYNQHIAWDMYTYLIQTVQNPLLIGEPGFNIDSASISARRDKGLKGRPRTRNRDDAEEQPQKKRSRYVTGRRHDLPPANNERVWPARPTA